MPLPATTFMYGMTLRVNCWSVECRVSANSRNASPFGGTMTAWVLVRSSPSCSPVTLSNQVDPCGSTTIIP